MKFKEKIITIAVVFVLLLLMAGFGAFKPAAASKKSGEADITADPKAEAAKVTSLAKLKKLGGIESRMPENSAFVFFQSTLGTKLSSYKAYGSNEETLCALRSGDIDAMWACDVTADYICKKNADLTILPTGDMSDIENMDIPRLKFGMALKDDEKHRKLCEDINLAMKKMRENGKMDVIVSRYIENADAMAEDNKEIPIITEADMKSKDLKGDTIYVGISGAVEPLELLDNDRNPYGFCVAFMDEIGVNLQRKVKFVVLDNETIFTSLMSGRIDLVFTYGTGNVTVEGKKSYIMTDGYYTMDRYQFVVKK